MPDPETILTAASAVAALKVLKLPDAALEFAKRLFGPAADEAGNILADPIRAFRARRLARVIERSEAIVREAGFSAEEIRPPKPRVLLPTLEEASLVDDDEPELVELWAGLLATTAIASDVPPRFVRMLAELSQIDARILEAAWQVEDVPYRGGVPPVLSKDDAVRIAGSDTNLTGHKALVRLEVYGLIVIVDRAARKPPTKVRYEVCLTEFAKQFLLACHGPEKKVRK